MAPKKESKEITNVAQKVVELSKPKILSNEEALKLEYNKEITEEQLQEFFQISTKNEDTIKCEKIDPIHMLLDYMYLWSLTHAIFQLKGNMQIIFLERFKIWNLIHFSVFMCRYLAEVVLGLGEYTYANRTAIFLDFLVSCLMYVIWIYVFSLFWNGSDCGIHIKSKVVLL